MSVLFKGGKKEERDSQVQNTSTDGWSTLAGSMQNDDFFFHLLPSNLPSSSFLDPSG